MVCLSACLPVCLIGQGEMYKRRCSYEYRQACWATNTLLLASDVFTASQGGFCRSPAETCAGEFYILQLKSQVMVQKGRKETGLI